MLNTIFLQAAGAPQQGNPYSGLLLLVGFIVIFYFFMIRPQRQQQKKLQEERNTMKKGDHVITSGGLYGKIEGVKMGPADKKGNSVPESFFVSLKPDYAVTVEISKDCVFKDAADVAAAQQQK